MPSQTRTVQELSALFKALQTARALLKSKSIKESIQYADKRSAEPQNHPLDVERWNRVVVVLEQVKRTSQGSPDALLHLDDAVRQLRAALERSFLVSQRHEATGHRFMTIKQILARSMECESV